MARDQMSPEMLSAWTDALRSGDYIQGTGNLHNLDEDSWCCLGVLADVAAKSGCKIKRGKMTPVAPNLEHRVVESFDGDIAWFPPTVLDFVGTLPISPWPLMKMNDHLKLSFSEIADRLEAAEAA